MHSRIFKIVDTDEIIENIVKEHEDDIFEQMNYVADYVVEVDSDEFLSSVEWWMEKNVSKDDNGNVVVTFPAEFKEAWMKNKMQTILDYEPKFVEMFQKIRDSKDLTDFTNEIADKLFFDMEFVAFDFSEIVRNKFGFYIKYQGDLLTFDEFVEVFLKVDVESKFIVSQVFDYHF